VKPGVEEESPSDYFRIVLASIVNNYILFFVSERFAVLSSYRHSVVARLQ